MLLRPLFILLLSAVFYAAAALGAESSLIQQAGIENLNPDKVVVLSLDPNLGDSLIFEYGRLAYLHRRYPQAQIVLIDKNNIVLRDQRWLRRVSIPVPDPVQPAEAEKVASGAWTLGSALRPLLEKEVDAKTLVLSEGSALSISEMTATGTYMKTHSLKRADLSATIKKNISSAYDDSSLWEIGRDKGATVLETNYVFSPGRSLVLKPPSQVPVKIPRLQSAEEAGIENRYERSEFYLKQQFGPDASVSWDPALFMDPKTALYRRERFLSDTFSHPENDYLMIDLNTKGERKVATLAHDYGARLGEILDHLRSTQKNLNVLVAPPLAGFGGEVARLARQAVNRARANGQAVAFLPEADLDIRKPLFQGASAIVAQDSGGYHLASVFNDRVMMLSRGPDPSGGSSITGIPPTAAERWHRPGRPWIDFESGQGALLNWLDQVLPKHSLMECMASQMDL